MTDLAHAERIKTLENALRALAASVDEQDREIADLRKRVEALEGGRGHTSNGLRT